MGEVDHSYYIYKSQKYTNSAGLSSLPAHEHSPASVGGPGVQVRRPLASDNLEPVNIKKKQEPLDTVNYDPLGLDNRSLCKKKKPPDAKEQSFIVVKHASELFLVNVICKVMPDKKNESNVKEGETDSSSIPVWQSPSYSYEKGKITKINGKFEWKGVIKIQTSYGPGINPTEYSCYGRGTTKEDIESGDVTLGFHESCHRNDYIGFLRNKSNIPKLPVLKVGMRVGKFKSEINKFKLAYEKYSAMYSKCSDKTDECGFTLKKHKSNGKCFNHAFCSSDDVAKEILNDKDFEGF